MSRYQWPPPDAIPFDDLPPEQRFILGLAALMRSIAVPTMTTRRRTAKDIDTLMRMRCFRFPGELGKAQQEKIWRPITPEKLHKNREVARPLFFGPGTLLRRTCQLAFRELARQSCQLE